jgi:decaprenylphospho-beta-D-ribofuranose 2-oxidase
MIRSKLSGWGLTPACLTYAEVASKIALPTSQASPNTVIPRGLGRGYGDCAINGFGITALTTDSKEFVLDDSVLVADSGASIAEILQFVVPRGYFIPVTPGTKFVTIGGAIAADVHGKNHHKDGSFGNFVVELDLLIADGTTQRISPLINPKLFWGTIGGMGLTGLILRAKIQLARIETSKILSTNIICSNLEVLMDEMIRADETAKYSVAWVDTLAGGKHLGRSILSIGDHATEIDLDSRLRKTPLKYSSKQLISFPKIATNGLLNRFTVRLFNGFWFQKARLSKKRKIVSFDNFFYPLDGIGNWNRMYGRDGFIQYQICVPDSEAHLIRLILEKFSEHRIPSFLSVLKRFGPQGNGTLSFPSKGWTLAVDIPAGVERLGELLDELDEKVVEAGGRIYLAKDSRMNQRFVKVMYPLLDEFREVKRTVDVHNMFQSNLSRRLGL